MTDPAPAGNTGTDKQFSLVADPVDSAALAQGTVADEIEAGLTEIETDGDASSKPKIVTEDPKPTAAPVTQTSTDGGANGPPPLKPTVDKKEDSKPATAPAHATANGGATTPPTKPPAKPETKNDPVRTAKVEPSKAHDHHGGNGGGSPPKFAPMRVANVIGCAVILIILALAYLYYKVYGDYESRIQDLEARPVGTSKADLDSALAKAIAAVKNTTTPEPAKSDVPAKPADPAVADKPKDEEPKKPVAPSTPSVKNDPPVASAPVPADSNLESRVAKLEVQMGDAEEAIGNLSGDVNEHETKLAQIGQAAQYKAPAPQAAPSSDEADIKDFAAFMQIRARNDANRSGNVVLSGVRWAQKKPYFGRLQQMGRAKVKTLCCQGIDGDFADRFLAACGIPVCTN